jgi:hypothetical protein
LYRRPQKYAATLDAGEIERLLYAAGIATCAVDEELTMIHPVDRLPAGVVEGLPQTLLKAYNEVCAVIDNLRQSRDVLHKNTVTRLQDTTGKLKEVTDATELAANGILDGLDRSLTLVDRLETIDAGGSADAAEARAQLREELYQTQAFLQFQDITSQQLNYASSILVDMEQRLGDLARALDPASSTLVSVSAPPVPSANLAFDPGATVHGADVRQALADAIFTVARA